jgi:hypothetical protein
MSMTSKRLRYAERVPPMPEQDARRLRRLPADREARIVESAVDALLQRGRGTAAALRASGRTREAAALLRDVELLERADDLHSHASRLETLAQLYRALVTLAGPEGSVDLGLDESPAWLQCGALEDQTPGAHGPAFRATAALRARAFRLALASLARARRALSSRA